VTTDYCSRNGDLQKNAHGLLLKYLGSMSFAKFEEIWWQPTTVLEMVIYKN
jgi:hypothetical protein